MYPTLNIDRDFTFSSTFEDTSTTAVDLEDFSLDGEDYLLSNEDIKVLATSN